MQIDMHFYGVYALCRLAGIDAQHAHTIAYASQYVDDRVGDKNMIFRKPQKALPAVMTSHKPIDYKNAIYEDQWRVWTSFHFLPGNKSKQGKFEEKMICRKNSQLAKMVLDRAKFHAGEDFGIYLVGIAAHSFADSFAHYGFLGISSPWNRVDASSIKTFVRSRKIYDYIRSKFTGFIDRIKGSFAEIIPVGHGAVATYPDRPYLKWEYRYEKGRRATVKRENWKDYLEAARLMHEFFMELLEKRPDWGNSSQAVSWNDFSNEIEKILKFEAKKDGRVRKWKRFIKNNPYFQPDDLDKRIHYREGLWNITQKQQKMVTESEVRVLPLFNFMTAARVQVALVRNYLREEGIIF